MSIGKAEARAKGVNAVEGGIFRRGIEMKCNSLEEEETKEGKERTINVYGVHLSQVTSFKYMGRVLSTDDDDWHSVVHSLRQARKKWAQLTCILIREGEDAQTL